MRIIANKDFYYVLDRIHELERRYKTTHLLDIPDFEFRETKEVFNKDGQTRRGPKKCHEFVFIDLKGNVFARDTSIDRLSTKIKPLFIEKGLGGYGRTTIRNAFLHNHGETKVGYIVKNKL